MSRLAHILRTCKQSFNKDELNKLIFVANSACNLKCSHCFYWQRTNQKGDLQWDEIELISRGLPRFKRLLISGGEPFLRKELPDIVRLFHRNNDVRAVVIATNGTLTDRMELLLMDILKIDPNLSIELCVSLDGTAEVHDTLRGMEGTFEKVIKSIKLLNDLKKKYKHLSIYLTTVILAHNMNNMKELIDFVRSQGDNFVDMHYFDIIRGSPREPALKNIHAPSLRNLLMMTILPYQEASLKRLKRAYYRFFAPLFAKLEAVLLAYEYKIQYENLLQGKPWGIQCQAGRTMLVIDSNGDFRSCESRPPLTNVRRERYAIKSFLNSERFRHELKEIREGNCYCTHSCFIVESIWKSPRTLFFRYPLLLIRGFMQSPEKFIPDTS
jgi:MoaA/NifB/PqqE/SkfB family radical SAM enzyme